MHTDLQTIRQFLLKLKQLQCFAFEVKCKDDKQLSGNMDLSDTQDEVKTMDLIATLKVLNLVFSKCTKYLPTSRQFIF